MDRDVQDRVVARASALWRAYGCPKGGEADYLYQAGREIALNDQLLAFKTSERAAPTLLDASAVVDVASRLGR